MTEVYKVGITIALTNKVSSALSLIRGDLAKTDAAALRLKSTLKEIKLLGVGGAILGGAGFMGLKALEKGYDAAKKYEQALNQFKSLSLGDAVNRDADKFARGSQVIGASATDLISTVRDLHTALGDYGMAKSLGAQVAQMKFANQAVFGGHGMDFSERQLQAMEKIIEMKGGFKSPAQFMAQADMMQKVISGTGGMVKPSDYLQFIKTAGVGGRLLSNESFYYAMEPLIQEMSGGRVGTGTMSAYNNLAQGKSTVRAAREMMRLGLLDPKNVDYDKIGQVKSIHPGALKGMDQFTSDPFEWMKSVLIPSMAAKGITGEKAILNEMGAIFGNRTGSNLFSLMYLQQDKIAKNMAISKNAMGVDQLVKMAKSSPQGAEMALGKSWENLKIAAGEALIPIVIPALLKLAEGFRSLGGVIDRHPTLFKYLVEGAAALSALALAGGSILILTAGVKAVGLLARFALPLSTMAGIPLAGMASGLGLLTAALAALVPILYHKQIAAWIDSHAPAVGDALLATRDFLTSGAKPSSGNRGYAPPSSGKSTTVHTQVNLDGRQIATAVSQHQARAANGPASSGSGFDARQGYTQPGATGAW